QIVNFSRIHCAGFCGTYTRNDKERIMYRAMLLGALVAAVAVAPPVTAAPHVEQFHAVFSGFNEVGGLNAFTGAILSPGQATLELRLNRADQTLSFVLRYSGLQNDVTQAHIHFGKSHMA